MMSRGSSNCAKRSSPPTATVARTINAVDTSESELVATLTKVIVVEHPYCPTAKPELDLVDKGGHNLRPHHMVS